jgi:hypothetical protein
MAKSVFLQRVDALEGPQGAILKALYSRYPQSLSAKDLMSRMRLPFESSPVTAFASLCIHFSDIDRLISSYGWQATRTGGTPDDRYRLSPV